jgi:hypothetical protein
MDLMTLPWIPPDVEVTIAPRVPGKSSRPDNVLAFPPYAAYDARTHSMREFISLTSVSYQLAQQTLFAAPRELLSKVAVGEPRPERWSYSMADVVPQPEIFSGWLRYEEYAEHEGKTTDEIRELAEAGQLGPMRSHPSDGAPVVLWPPEDRRPEDFKTPEPGSYDVIDKYTVKVSEPGPEFELSDRVQLEAARAHYLRLANSLGEVDKVAIRAQAIMFRAAFLLEWASFETFLRETVTYLLGKHPQVLVDSAGRKATLSYEQIFTMSSQLSSLEDFRRMLVDLEVEKLRAGGRSIHGMINFLKSAFRFKNDPYEAWYVINGTRHTATYNDLLAIKERRNVLAHEASIEQGSGEQVRQDMTEDEYGRTILALRSVAYSISRSVYYERYEVHGTDGPDGNLLLSKILGDGTDRWLRERRVLRRCSRWICGTPRSSSARHGVVLPPESGEALP